MRVAIVHDWLVGMRGGERCLELLCALFPEAHIYTAFYEPENISEVIRRQRINCSTFGRLPQVNNYYRHLLPVYPLVAKDIERRINLQAKKAPYDLMISVSHCLAKNVRAPAGTPHISYCLTPVRYLWDHYDTYFGDRPAEVLIRQVAKLLRRWDLRGSEHVDRFIGISRYIAERIRRVYGRDAAVLYPPVRTDWIEPRDEAEPGSGFLCVSALVPYKNIELIIRAFNRLKHPLTVVGRGPEEERLRALAEENIRFLPFVNDDALSNLYRNSRALVFAAEEDFGMAPVEAQAAGRPVICYARGGALETVRAGSDRPTGLYFNEPTEEALIAAVEEFCAREDEFTVANCVSRAEEFSVARFYRELSATLRDFGLEVSPEDNTRLMRLIAGFSKPASPLSGRTAIRSSEVAHA